ncbi:MAG: DUF1552 domain-containing protein [Rhodopirellula sp.]|uniref:Secreted protein containing DUF1552 n=1 Tax=Rhodopirellula europaea SH398 TaxID=1263868 RepID=M5S9V3_9BACT|nr:DUF1552 domain-containing protein [Rhodopirellula europaea]EMI28261.1 secreted protein containing DUF1552 [Rhodopirellula europaea SH398]MAP09587.1 DUF1552 domain-containing protein [Rhodopirellula sp.]MCR9210848.1 DUF1552 domain-containing protein [bacterium]
MSHSPRTFSRRLMLRGMGTSVALPLLDVMSPTRLLAATSDGGPPPLRMGFFYVPNGMHMPAWTPQKDGREFELTPTLQKLAENKDSISVLSGLTLDGARAHGDGGGDHARSVAAFLTGAHPRKTNGADIQNGVSVDQVAAQYVGDRTRFASLELGLEASSQAGNCDSGYSCAYASNMSWRGPTNPMAKETDPRALFDRLFAGQTIKETRRAKSEREKYRKSILDFVASDAKRLHAHLPIVDRRKLDEYLYSIRDVEKRLDGAEKLGLTEEGVPDYPRPSGVPQELSRHSDLMMDMVALAYQTDSTRILSFMFTNAGSNRAYKEIGVNEGHHELSHHGKSEHKQAEIAKINSFHAERFNYLLSRLKLIREGDGSLLDNCMIVYGSGISDGDRHNHDDLPILLAGGGGGRIRAGQHVRYKNGTPLCNLYLWMMKQIGANADRFGDSSGVLQGLG